MGIPGHSHAATKYVDGAALAHLRKVGPPAGRKSGRHACTHFLYIMTTKCSLEGGYRSSPPPNSSPPTPPFPDTLQQTHPCIKHNGCHKSMAATSPSTSRIRTQGPPERASDERRPLLGDDLEAKLTTTTTTTTTTTPLPLRQLTILCMLRVLDPLAFSQIFPYINNFMEDLRLTDDPSRVGFYSGLVVCVMLWMKRGVMWTLTYIHMLIYLFG